MRVGVSGSVQGSAIGRVLDDRIAERLSEAVTLQLPVAAKNHITLNNYIQNSFEF